MAVRTRMRKMLKSGLRRIGMMRGPAPVLKPEPIQVAGRGRLALVAGGAGFIGSHLCEALLKRGFRVTCVDSLISGRLSNISGPAFAKAKAQRRFRFVKHDIQQPLRLKAGFVFNLASPASPPHYQAHSLLTLRTGSEGTWNLLNLAEQSGARFFHASTSEVYGDPRVHPQREDYWGHVNPIGPRACYDEAKRYAEALIMEFHRKRGLDTRMIRIFNTYGPRLDPEDGRVVSNYIKQALRGEPLTVYGSGRQTRSFQYVSDLVEAILRVMFTPGLEACVFNVGNPGEFTMLEAARLVQRLTGSRSELIHQPLPQDDPVRRRPDISRIQAALGWAPQVPFEKGLEETIAWFRKEEMKA